VLRRMPRLCRMCLAALTSSTGSAVSETPQRVADALRKQGADADGGLDETGGRRAGLRHPEVQWG